MTIYIGEDIRALCPQTVIGVLTYNVQVEESGMELKQHFNEITACLQEKYKIPDIAGRTHIAETREAYKALGKSPSHYRNASEAMLRRIVKGSGLYQINNVVDLNNLVSVKSGYSLGSYDSSKLSGDIWLHRAADGENYAGIGRDAVNIGYLPVLYDEKGAFGNPTSDSERAKITPGLRNVISIIYAFAGENDLPQWMDTYETWLTVYTDAENVEKFIVK